MNIEHENTKRALAEQPLLQKSKWCNLGIHTWEQWSQPYTPKGASQSIQHRYCASCNKVEGKWVSVKNR